MAFLERTQVGVRDIGRTVSVPNDPKARLMFYLSCVSTVLDIGDKVPRKLVTYTTNYNRLSEDDITELLAHCILFSPDVLNDKVFFEDNSQGGSVNKFLELSAVQSSMLMAGNIVIGGQNRRVAKIMTYTRNWMRTYYEEAMVSVLADQLRRREAAHTPAIRQRAIQAAPRNNSNDDSCCCIVM